jgi:NADH dehydrogenase (ubiquinone) 1 alpha subcomplex subunit 2
MCYLPLLCGRFPILIRECSGIHPKLWARYGFGRETSIDISGKTADEVYAEIAKL